ncbi:respirasome Complex Assembly Factor 1-like [Mytilus californianus]|uniref:respirasome Complex Assembly Factor 1-like n=1 Tax=Mytilus californianus TaxID=6549 RepID=UPI002246FDAF|nr:respirasome Complex Assembly Factor 1-like [Mytilus californianus]
MKAATKIVKAGEKSQNGSLIKASLNKALSAEAEWDDKDEFLDVIYWMRQILGLILGIVWGLIPLKGIIGLVLFLAVNVGIVYFYYNSFQKIDDEEYGGPSEILKEGLMTSFSTFVVAWILLYSALHTDL